MGGETSYSKDYGALSSMVFFGYYRFKALLAFVIGDLRGHRRWHCCQRRQATQMKILKSLKEVSIQYWAFGVPVILLCPACF